MVTVSGGALAIDLFVSTFILENIFFGGPAFPGLDVSQQPLVQNSWGLRVNPGRQFFFFSFKSRCLEKQLPFRHLSPSFPLSHLLQKGNPILPCPFSGVYWGFYVLTIIL